MADRDHVVAYFKGSHRKFYSRYIKFPEGQSEVKVLSPFRTETKPSFEIKFLGRYPELGFLDHHGP